MTTLFSHKGVVLSAGADGLEVSGDLGTEVAAALADAGMRWLAEPHEGGLTLDFRGVNRASSAAVSVLLQWLRTCRQHAVVVEHIRLSAPLQRLASLAELDRLFDHPAA